MSVEEQIGCPAARELHELLEVAKLHGYGLARVKLTAGAELVLVPRDPVVTTPAPKREADETDDGFAARVAREQKAAKDRQAHIDRLAKELGVRRATALVDSCLVAGGPIP
jgi:hypothetical protein